MESDLFDVDAVDIRALKAFISELKRCTVAAEACLAEKQFSALNARKQSTDNDKDAPSKRPPLKSITTNAALDRKPVAFHLSKPQASRPNTTNVDVDRKAMTAQLSKPHASRPEAALTQAAQTPEAAQLHDQLELIQRRLIDLDLAKPAEIRSHAPSSHEQHIPSGERPLESDYLVGMPAHAPNVPRMPRLLVVLDTNELIAGHAMQRTAIDRAFLLQDCSGCTIVLPAQVASELDGLKRSGDVAKAARARQANALLSVAARHQEPWLLCEPRGSAASTASGLTADEHVLRCATTFARAHALPMDRILLATSDANLLLRAAAEQVEAMPLAEARRHAEARHFAWRAAYAGHAAADAISAGRWASVAQS